MEQGPLNPVKEIGGGVGGGVGEEKPVHKQLLLVQLPP
jgi:hypothetical protein